MDHTAKADFATSGGAAGHALGNTAKSSSPDAAKLTKAKRAERYAALSSARSWLGRTAFKIDPEKNPGDVYRTHDCRFARRSEFVSVNFAALHQKAHYGNLATCGSVWACPVCCQLIQQRRRPEISQLIEWAYAGDKTASMITLTFPHTKFDSLGDLLSKQRDAFKRLRSGKIWQGFKERYCFEGLVRSLELTHGKNGWHPHTHELWVSAPIHKRDREDFRSFIIDRWVKACTAAGLLDRSDAHQLQAFHLHAVDVRFDAKESDYLAKQDSGRSWGVDREIALASSKKGKASGVHPHEFLIRQAVGDYDRYIEYVHAMKGARQLYWSSRLKSRVGITDVTDEQIAEREDEQAEVLGLLTADQWRYVRGNDARAELLDAAESAGWQGVEYLLRSLGYEFLTNGIDPFG
ncbi:protein rep [Pseudomonas amygdali]|uniref:protein rep n=1 Tax=Pseudomonas amygdali TaxID=47877 RepID=UPI003966F976